MSDTPVQQPKKTVPKKYLSFWLTLLSLLFTGIVAVWKDPSAVSYLPMILSVYIGARAVENGSAHWAASKDPNCNTKEVIDQMRSP